MAAHVFLQIEPHFIMLIIRIKDNENIDRALRRYKKKLRQVNLLSDVRKKKHFEKPSKRRRIQVEKAKYQQKIRQELEA